MFDHEKLRVYQEALQFAAAVEVILERAKKSSPLYGQLDRARASILLNIAEGNGRFTAADRCRFLGMARGSTLECAACLDLLAVKMPFQNRNWSKAKNAWKILFPCWLGLSAATPQTGCMKRR